MTISLDGGKYTVDTGLDARTQNVRTKSSRKNDFFLSKIAGA
jgi:hypothetical protein